MLLDAGWQMKSGGGKGSHRKYFHSERREVITMPWHQSREIKKGLAGKILKQAGLK